jgi:phenylpropionate dioxygenase-like ring-hydroxylating dioxygenase large terminal subunit
VSAGVKRTNSHTERAELFLQAARWLHERGGDAAVVRAFGNPVPIDEAWERDLEGFKDFLRDRCREALEAERGAA